MNDQATSPARAGDVRRGDDDQIRTDRTLACTSPEPTGTALIAVSPAGENSIVVTTSTRQRSSAVRFATIAAALSMRRAGAVPAIPTREEIDHFRC